MVSSSDTNLSGKLPGGPHIPRRRHFYRRVALKKGFRLVSFIGAIFMPVRVQCLNKHLLFFSTAPTQQSNRLLFKHRSRPRMWTKTTGRNPPLNLPFLSLQDSNFSIHWLTMVTAHTCGCRRAVRLASFIRRLKQTRYLRGLL